MHVRGHIMGGLGHACVCWAGRCSSGWLTGVTVVGQCLLVELDSVAVVGHALAVSLAGVAVVGRCLLVYCGTLWI